MISKKRIENDQRKEAILQAVSPLFATKGISVTTKELAAVAGVSEALIYKHFKSKQELFTEVQTRCCGSVHPVADLVTSEADPQERLALSLTLLSYVILVGFEDDILPKSEVHKMVLRSLALDGEFSSQIFSNFERWIPAISDGMTENQSLGHLTKTNSSNEELLWMAHHFILGVAVATLPEKRHHALDLSSDELIEKTTTHALLMIGMKYDQATKLFKKVYNKFKNFKGVK